MVARDDDGTVRIRQDASKGDARSCIASLLDAFYEELRASEEGSLGRQEQASGQGCNHTHKRIRQEQCK